MSVINAIILGFIQGVAEFLPISSSGHLSILQNLFGMNTAEEGHMFFDVLLHFGTLVSIFIVYWRDIKDMCVELVALVSGNRHPTPAEKRPAPARRLVIMIIVSILPLFIVLPLKDYVEALYYKTIFIGFALIITGFLLFISDKIANGSKNEKNMRIKDALIVGVCQAVAVIPGLSRSGSTISGGIASGLSREFAVKFSFLMSIPAILGANVLSLVDAVKEGVDATLLPVYLLGMAVAAAVGIVAINLVKLISRSGKFGNFAYYCWVVGVLSIVLTLIFD
jgi:undecaprenyl-diphosphatase